MRGEVFSVFLAVLTLGIGVSGQAEAGRLGDLDISPEVRRQWTVLLEAAGLELAPEDIPLPTKPVSKGFYPFRFFDGEFTLGSREFWLHVHPKTGEPMLWAEHTAGEHGPAVPKRTVEEARTRIESLAPDLLPAATQRVLLRGPQYLESYGTWRMYWSRTEDGIPFVDDNCRIEVRDSDLSLRSYGNSYWSPKPADMTVAIESDQATNIACAAAKTLHQRIYQTSQAPEPELVEEPALRIVPYNPKFMEERIERRDRRIERRVAWEVNVRFREERDDGSGRLEKWYLWVDAKSGEVIGGDHMVLSSVARSP